MSRAVVNRALLCIAGVCLLIGGLLVLAGGLDLYGRLGVTMPSGWPLTSPDQPVVSSASRTRWAGHGWFWPTAITVLSLTVIGALWWLFAQLRRSGPSTYALPAPGVRLRGRALEDAMETETVALPEVTRVQVRLTSTRGGLLIRAAVRLEPRGGPAALLDRFHSGPLTHARTTLGLPDLPAELRLQVSGKPRATPKHPRVL